MGWWTVKPDTTQEILDLQRTEIARLRADNERLSAEVLAARSRPAIELPPPPPPDPEEGGLPRNVESAIRAKFGWNPMGAALTRSAVANRLRVTHGDVDAVLREIDHYGEVVE